MENINKILFARVQQVRNAKHLKSVYIYLDTRRENGFLSVFASD